MILKFEDKYVFRCYNGKRLLWTETVYNLVTTQGVNDVPAVYFKGVAYNASWYIGLVDNDHFSALAVTDTAAKITTSNPTGGTNGWKENTNYSEANRPTLTL